MKQPQYKTCCKCLVNKPIRNFWRKKFSQDGRDEICGSCRSEYQKERYAAAIKKEEELRDADPNRWEQIIQNRLWADARKRSLNMGIEFTIQAGDIKVPKRCPILGTEFYRSANNLGRNSPSLDRKDSGKGYVPGNVFVISWKANNVKSNLTVEEVEKLLEYMRSP